MVDYENHEQLNNRIDRLNAVDVPKRSHRDETKHHT